MKRRDLEFETLVVSVSICKLFDYYYNEDVTVKVLDSYINII